MPAGRNATPYYLFQRVLINVRRRRKLTQNEMARLCGVTPSAVSQWEKIGRYVGEETLARVAAGLGEPLIDLLQRELAAIAHEPPAAAAAAP